MNSNIMIIEHATRLTEPVPGTALCKMFFSLSDYPDPDWEGCFAKAWKVKGNVRSAGTHGKKLWIECLPEEGAVYFPKIQKAVEKANAAYKASWENAPEDEVPRRKRILPDAA